MTHVFKHPNYYKELRKRNKAARIPPTSSGQAAADQAISPEAHDGERGRAPDPGLKPQASSNELEASSDKPQAASDKRSLESL